MTAITLKEQIAEVGRELGMRKSFYPKRVAGGHMTQEDADMHLSRLDAVYRTLKWLETHRYTVVNEGLEKME